MAWQYETGAGSDRATDYRDLLTKMVAFLTSQGVATVAINNAGTGYTTGDILTLTHAGAYLDAKFEVTAVAGVITALRIVANGAFSNRIASATVVSGGTGYAVNDVLEVQGGTSREKGKVRVATLSGSAVATVALFETGGAYSSAPGAASTTTKVGPAAGSGSGCTVTPTMTGLIGTTGLAVTGGTGSSATVNITLAQTGWAVDGRNTNNTTVNSVTNEKQVVLKGDAAGWTNKPYIGFGTVTATSGVNTRYAIAFYGMTSHNSATSMFTQVGIKGSSSQAAGNPYLLCDQDDAQDMNFWFSADDKRFSGVLDTNSSAGTSDSREYYHFYTGYINSFATEAEDPYPMMCSASAGVLNQDPSVSSLTISGLSECYWTTGSEGTWMYVAEEATWRPVRNGSTIPSGSNIAMFMFPHCDPTYYSSMSPTADAIVSSEFTSTAEVWISLAPAPTGRTSPAARLLMLPGTTSYHYPIPLTPVYKYSSTTSESLDTVRGTLQGWYWVYNTDSSGATITNFAEDYLTIGSDRYRIFHTHVQKQLYHYVCIKESV